MESTTELFARLGNRFDVMEMKEQKRELGFIQISRKDAVPLITHLRDVEGYTHLVFLTAVDYPEKGFFTLHYLLHNYDTCQDLGVKVDIPRENSSMDTIHYLWKQAATYQRELKEMFGIDFPGSPGVDDPFILEGWEEIPPMRRDFDTRAYSEKTFYPRPGRTTHDPAEHMKEQLYREDV